ncbi:unnamed protein product [Clonostachys rosea]|uniref:Uncharacterized protein n=1 Tax=Bionectria ochroleuca TaxID=29856 RepID=A0ABY6UZK2_BIOOC|nr:unnamed protein product [Clonostachys rosea]
MCHDIELSLFPTYAHGLMGVSIDQVRDALSGHWHMWFEAAPECLGSTRSKPIPSQRLKHLSTPPQQTIDNQPIGNPIDHKWVLQSHGLSNHGLTGMPPHSAVMSLPPTVAPDRT